MFKKLIILVVLCAVSVPVFAQSVDTAWVRRYNGPANSGDDASAIAVDGSGNVYVTGYSYGSGTDCDYATIKYYPDGDTAWVRRYNGLGNSYDGPYAIAIDDYGNVYVTGVSVGSGTSGDYATIKYYPDGDTAWVRRYNGPGNLSDYACAIAIDSFNNIYVTGYSIQGSNNYDYATIKYDLDGNEIWVRRYDGPGNTNDLAYAITTDGYGNIYVTGGSGGDYATIKYDSSGNELWVRTKDGTGSNDNAYSIAVDVYDNVYVTGYNVGVYQDYITVKYDSSGKEIWAKSYNGPGIGRDEAHAIGVDDFGNAYVTGFSIGSGTDYDYATIKYDSSGNEVWVRRYNGPGNSLDGGSAMAIDFSNNIYVTGHSVGSGGDRDYATIGYDPSGNERWVKRYNGPGNSFDGASAIAVDGSGNVYVTGGSWDETNSDYATIKYRQNYPPNAFSILSPSDSAIIPYVVFFDWETAIDPDPWDTVRYDLYISISSSFHPDSTVILHGLLVNQYTDTLEWGRYYWKVRAYDRHSEIWSNQTWTFFSGILGDANGDKKVTVADVIYLINFLFKSGPAPNPYQAGNVNCDGYVTVSDVVYLVNYLFKGGPKPCS